jgi:hypothetical protein
MNMKNDNAGTSIISGGSMEEEWRIDSFDNLSNATTMIG